jgi:hypothetical protein
MKVYGGFLAGYHYDMVELFNVINTYDYDSKSNGFTTGITLDFMKPKQFKSLFGSFSLSYFRAEHSGKFDVSTFSHPSFHMQYNGLSLSYGGYYCYRHFKLQPYTGLALLGSLTHKSKTIYDDMDVNYTNLSKLIITCGIAGGLIYNFSDSFYTRVMVEYQPKLEELTYDVNFETRTRALNAVMAILYNF